jgi:hypothetical protein
MDLQPGQELFLQSGAYLASTTGVQLDTKWQGAKGFFSGEGLFLLRAYGQGRLWFSSYGGIHTPMSTCVLVLVIFTLVGPRMLVMCTTSSTLKSVRTWSRFSISLCIYRPGLGKLVLMRI